MASVTQRIKQITQPRGGYLATKLFTRTVLDDGKILNEIENLHASNVGIAVDYLSRFMLGEPLEKAFAISLMGARLIGEINNASLLLSKISGLDDNSIICACKLSGYDVCYRASIMGFKPVSLINPDENTISNIRIMVERSLAFFDKYGPITYSGFTFEGGYTDFVNAGDGDFCTKNTIWDFKVSKKHITPAHTLQILMYYIMGKHSTHDFFNKIERLGFFNPRLNTVYLCSISDISSEIINIVENEVICYNKPFIASPSATRAIAPITTTETDLSVSDVCQITGLPKSEIYKAIRNHILVAYKKGNKYLITRENLEAYIEYRKKVATFSFVFLGVGVIIILLLCAILL